MLSATAGLTPTQQKLHCVLILVWLLGCAPDCGTVVDQQWTFFSFIRVSSCKLAPPTEPATAKQSNASSLHNRSWSRFRPVGSEYAYDSSCHTFCDQWHFQQRMKQQRTTAYETHSKNNNTKTSVFRARTVGWFFGLLAN